MSDKLPWKRLAARCSQAAAPGGRARVGRVVLEGTRLCERALRADITLTDALLSETFAATSAERPALLRAELARRGVAPLVAPDGAFRELTGGRDLGGILALAEPPPAADPARVLRRAGPTRSTILVCADIAEPGNVGALVRTAHASGAALFVAAGTADPFHPKAIRTSMGSVFRIPVLHAASAEEARTLLKEHDVHCVAAESEGGTPLPWARFPSNRIAVFVGSEAHGLAPTFASRLDTRLTIPMPGGVDSFSVNAAAAVLLYELRRDQESPAPALDPQG